MPIIEYLDVSGFWVILLWGKIRAGRFGGREGVGNEVAVESLSEIFVI